MRSRKDDFFSRYRLYFGKIRPCLTAGVPKRTKLSQIFWDLLSAPRPYERKVYCSLITNIWKNELQHSEKILCRGYLQPKLSHFNSKFHKETIENKLGHEEHLLLLRVVRGHQFLRGEQQHDSPRNATAQPLFPPPPAPYYSLAVGKERCFRKAWKFSLNHKPGWNPHGFYAH